MKILIAPDKFKGSLTATQVSAVIESALDRCDSSFSLQKFPLADGGEGTSALLTEFTGGSYVYADVRDPLFRVIKSGYGISNDGKTAFIEMAGASGLQLLKPEERNPLYTTTLGTGDLILHALERGVDMIVIGIGGSATNDAGLGIGQALGLDFLSSSMQKLRPVGESLVKVQHINFEKLHPRCAQVKCIVLCDVDNPLFGPHGAAVVYSPQKGADGKTVALLDEGLRHFGSLLQRRYHADIDFAGAGAAGGVSVMLKVLMNSEIRPGFEFIAHFTDLEKKIADSDVVITGEGKIDDQTFSGKVVQGVASLCMKYKKPLIAVAGKCDLTDAALSTLGVHHIIRLAGRETSEKDAIENASAILEISVRQQVFPVLKALKK